MCKNPLTATFVSVTIAASAIRSNAVPGVAWPVISETQKYKHHIH